jgi:hypothetical protein
MATAGTALKGFKDEHSGFIAVEKAFKSAGKVLVASGASVDDRPRDRCLRVFE